MSGRPPADVFLNEAIFDRKCGGKDKGQFHRWCMNGTGSVASTCKDIGGFQGACSFQGTVTANKNKTATFNVDFRCPNGASPEKWVNKTETVVVDSEKFDKIKLFCEQELFGKPFVLPWWMILLIVLAVVVVVGIASTLFWKLWLRNKLQKRDKTGRLSNYTSAPFSSSSNLAGSRLPSRNLSSGPTRGSFATMNTPPGDRSGVSRSRSGSGRSKRKSDRSLLSQSFK